MMEQMTKNELDRGMHVTLRDGSKCVLSYCSTDAVDLTLIDVKDGGYESLEYYRENMTHTTADLLDIVEVRDSNNNLIFAEERITRAEAERRLGVRIVD